MERERRTGTYGAESHSSTALTAFILSGLLIALDFLFYGLVLPLMGTYFAGWITVAFNLPPFIEMLLVIGAVFTLIFAVFYANIETRFWKHLFAQDIGYISVLQVRDLMNVGAIVYNLYFLYHTILAITSSGRGMNEQYIGQGAGFGLFRKLRRFGLPTPATWAIDPTIVPVEDERPGFEKLWDYISNFSLKPTPVSDVELVLGADFILAIAALTASVVKLLYFNTLYTYLRAMDIFMSMQNQSPYSFDESSMDAVSDESLVYSTPPKKVSSTRKSVSQRVYNQSLKGRYNNF